MGFAAEVKELWQLAEAARSSLGLGSHGNGAFWHVSSRTTSRQRSARERKMLGPAETEYWGKSLKPRPTRTPLPPKNHLSHPQTNLSGVPVSGSRLSSHPQLMSDVSISPSALPGELLLPSIAVERRQRPPCWAALLPQPLLSKKPGLQGLWKTLFTEQGRERIAFLGFIRAKTS